MHRHALVSVPLQSSHSRLEDLVHLHNNTATACATFLAGIVGAYGAFASGLTSAFCFIFEQVGGLDGHVDDVGVLQGEGEVWKYG